MGYNLFLDDVREPYEVGNYMNPVELRSMYRLKHWIVLRNYKQFVSYIKRNGMPELISFDHDLADEHYRPSMYNPDKHYSNYYTDGTFQEKTGYDCAKWLIEYAQERGLPLPQIFCHSMNPIGKENILNLVASQY